MEQEIYSFSEVIDHWSLVSLGQVFKEENGMAYKLVDGVIHWKDSEVIDDVWEPQTLRFSELMRRTFFKYEDIESGTKKEVTLYRYLIKDNGPTPPVYKMTDWSSEEKPEMSPRVELYWNTKETMIASI